MFSRTVFQVLGAVLYFSCEPGTVHATSKCPNPLLQAAPVEVTTAGPVSQITWMGSTDKVIYALDPTGYVYRSANRGASWVTESAKFKGIGEIQHQEYNAYGVRAFFAHSERPEQILFLGKPAGSEIPCWTTRDMGATYVQPCGYEERGEPCCELPGGSQSRQSAYPYMQLHPTQPNWILATVYRDSCFEAGGLCAQDLFVSHDFSQTWTNLTANAQGRIVSFHTARWSLGGIGDDEYAILATVFRSHDHLRTHQRGLWDKHVDLIRTQDFFKSDDEEVVPCGNAAAYVGTDLYVAVTLDCDKTTGPSTDTSGVQLLVSSNGGDSFHPVCFPVYITDKSYTFLDAKDETTFIWVDHDEEEHMEAQVPAGNMYTSDATMELFSLSMRRMYKERAYVDFERVHAIPGTFIANQLNENVLYAPDDPQLGIAYDDFIETKISFNNGAYWQDLVPPKTDSLGEPTCIRDGCRLHLHGPSSWSRWLDAGWFPAFYSHDNAPGLILATGSVSQTLEKSPDKVNTYLSRDGGQTWAEIRKGAHAYEYGDHGGIIVIARHASSGPTKEVFYSLDEGLCWMGPIELSTLMYVHNIRVEPESKGKEFILHGARTVVDSSEKEEEVKESKEGAMVVLDFSKLLSAEDFPNCKEGDYEFWTPTNDHCLLGKNITMERRKRLSRCYNGQDYERNVGALEHCHCDYMDDVACEYGFERYDGSHWCQPIPEFNISQCPELLGRKYNPFGDRLVSEDSCDRPQDVLRTEHNNGGKKIAKSGSSGGLSGGMIFFIVVLVLSAVCASCWVAYTKFGLGDQVPPEWKEKAAEYYGHAEVMWGQLMEKLNFQHLRSERMNEYFEPLNTGADEFDANEEEASATSAL